MVKGAVALVLVLLLVPLTACSTSASERGASTSASVSVTVSWDNASNHIGRRITVYGPVVDTRYASSSRGQPTFLNIGKPYPDPGRFTVVIWGENRGNFPSPPEVYYKGRTIFVTGVVTRYEGVPEIEASDLTQIREQ